LFIFFLFLSFFSFVFFFCFFFLICVAFPPDLAISNPFECGGTREGFRLGCFLPKFCLTMALCKLGVDDILYLRDGEFNHYVCDVESFTIGAASCCGCLVVYWFHLPRSFLSSLFSSMTGGGWLSYECHYVADSILWWYCFFFANLFFFRSPSRGYSVIIGMSNKQRRRWLRHLISGQRCGIRGRLILLFVRFFMPDSRFFGLGGTGPDVLSPVFLQYLAHLCEFLYLTFIIWSSFFNFFMVP